ncbi:MAG: hypothetical protein R2724_04395 [Bryobacterales bacterium]
MATPFARLCGCASWERAMPYGRAGRRRLLHLLPARRPRQAARSHFDRVRYSGVLPGVDLVYYGDPQQLEYDFVVAPRQGGFARRALPRAWSRCV